MMLRLAKGVRVQFERVTQTHVVLFPEGVVELNKSAYAVVRKLPIHVDELRSCYKDDIGTTDAELRELDAFVNEALNARWMNLT